MSQSKRSALGLAGLATVALVAAALTQARAEERAPDYTSSVKVDTKHHRGEREEAWRYADLAKIDAAQAITAAQTRVPGKVLSAALDNENGNLVYSVVIQPSQAIGAQTAGTQTARALQDVKVDAGNGAVLKVDAGNEGKDRDDEETD
jgi:uncharacterized membrane protein YkoI